jgi:hypothetical protein
MMDNSAFEGDAGRWAADSTPVTVTLGTHQPVGYFHGPGIARLAAALAAVQAELPVVTKNKEAEVKGTTRQGDRYNYTYKYADYADVAAKIMPLLGKHGLAFVCRPTERDDGKFGVAYDLIHESGESMSGWYPLERGLRPQDTGGLITYARRYALCAVTGVAAEEDTDAQGAQYASAGQQEAQRPRSQPQRQRPARAPAEPAREPLPHPVGDGQGGIAALSTDPADSGLTIQPEVQALADLAFLLVRQHRPVPELQASVYDEAKAHRGWLTAKATHPLDKTVETLAAIIRDAKGRLEAIAREAAAAPQDETSSAGSDGD